MKGKGQNIIIIKDECGYVFGGYSSMGWEIKDEENNFYGTGETFLFTFRDSESIRYHPWTQKNSFFQYANLKGVVMGMG